MAGQLCAYTFVRPLLTDVAGFDAALTGLLLLGYGVAGITGNFLAASGRDVRRTLLALLGGVPPIAVVALLLWGLAYGGVSVGLQTWILCTSPEAPETATSLFVCAFNLSIALGGLVADALIVAAVPRSRGSALQAAGLDYRNVVRLGAYVVPRHRSLAVRSQRAWEGEPSSPGAPWGRIALAAEDAVRGGRTCGPPTRPDARTTKTGAPTPFDPVGDHWTRSSLVVCCHMLEPFSVTACY
ncbi:hypothetical protein Q7689_03100 [Nocardiopsis tropica]|uniref:hypothetical protein n=1 Tax=Nocardiopsis tropica TaxID=109330 RepID=UPI002E852F18|nr:hypothetical protein [Nocardiopsis tropica]